MAIGSGPPPELLLAYFDSGHSDYRNRLVSLHNIVHVLRRETRDQPVMISA
jgi:hypothetical protein